MLLMNCPSFFFTYALCVFFTERTKAQVLLCKPSYPPWVQVLLFLIVLKRLGLILHVYVNISFNLNIYLIFVKKK